MTKTVAGAVLLFTLVNGFNALSIGSNYQRLVQGVVLIGATGLYTLTTLRKRRPKAVAPAVVLQAL